MLCKHSRPAGAVVIAQRNATSSQELWMYTEAALPKLFFKIADQLCEPLFGERVSGHPAGLFQSPFQFFAVALLVRECVAIVQN
jgi:hypothetical protein